MSDHKLESTYLNKLRTICDFAEAILRSLKHQNLSLDAIEKELKYFLKECRKINLINYPVAFLSSEVSEENLQSALDAIHKKIEHFQNETGKVYHVEPEEVSALLKICELIVAYQEKKYTKMPADAKRYPARFKELENILSYFELFQEKYLLLKNVEKFIEKYPVTTDKRGLYNFKKSLKQLYRKFLEACRQAELLPGLDENFKPMEVLGVPLKPDKKSIKGLDLFEIINNEISLRKAADKDQGLHTFLDSVRVSAEKIKNMYHALPGELEKLNFTYENLMFPWWLEEDEEVDVYNLRSNFVNKLSKDNIRNIIGSLNARDGRVILENFSEKFLIRALKQAVDENLLIAAISLSQHITARQKPRQGAFFSSSRTRQVDLQKQEILNFLSVKSQEGNETAKHLISSHQFENKRRTLSSPLPVCSVPTRLPGLS